MTSTQSPSSEKSGESDGRRRSSSSACSPVGDHRTLHQQIYETDFIEWIEKAAELLKQGQFSELDIENLIEEVEDLGKSQKQALKSNLRILLMHLLKWQYQAGKRSHSWIGTINEHRNRIHDLLEDSPSLKNQLVENLAKTYGQSRKRAALETGLDISIFPVECPYSVEHVLDDEFPSLEG